MNIIRPDFDWNIGDRVHILQKHEKGLMVALNGIPHVLSINNPIGRRLYGWSVGTMLVIVDKRRCIYNHEGERTLPWSNDCVGQTEIPVYVKLSL